MKRENLTRILVLSVLGLAAIVFLFPFFWMFSSSLKPLKAIFRYPPELIPSHPTTANFRQVLGEYRFGTYMFNSFFVASVVTFAALIFHSMAAFALARIRLPGRNGIFLFMVSTLMIPLYSILIPRYLIVNQLGWINTYWGLIIPAIPHAFGIFALRQFFLEVPLELEEAATIDGASRLTSFRIIFVPLSQGIMVTLGVLFFMANWDSFVWPLIVTTSDKMKLIQVGLAGFMDAQNPQWHLMIASATMTAIPSLIIFLCLQRYVVQGIKTTGTKL